MGVRLNGEKLESRHESISRHNKAQQIIALSSGALATSGGQQTPLLKDGIRFILMIKPNTGWPITDATKVSLSPPPTLASNAGIIATLALLQAKTRRKAS